MEFFSFSKPFNMTGWRIGFAVGNHAVLAHLWRLKTNMDSGMFDALQRTAAFILGGSWDFVQQMCDVYPRRRDLLAERFGVGGYAGAQAESHGLHVGARSGRIHVGQLSAHTCSTRQGWW